VTAVDEDGDTEEAADAVDADAVCAEVAELGRDGVVVAAAAGVVVVAGTDELLPGDAFRSFVTTISCPSAISCL